MRRSRPETAVHRARQIILSMDKIDLQRGRFLRLHQSAGSTVVTHTGSVWITEQDSPRDVVLNPGQSFTLSRSGLALVQAFDDASISFGRRG
jgi:hypothetical protein